MLVILIILCNYKCFLYFFIFVSYSYPRKYKLILFILLCYVFYMLNPCFVSDNLTYSSFIKFLLYFVDWFVFCLILSGPFSLLCSRSFYLHLFLIFYNQLFFVIFLVFFFLGFLNVFQVLYSTVLILLLISALY